MKKVIITSKIEDNLKISIGSVSTGNISLTVSNPKKGTRLSLEFRYPINDLVSNEFIYQLKSLINKI